MFKPMVYTVGWSILFCAGTSSFAERLPDMANYHSHVTMVPVTTSAPSDKIEIRNSQTGETQHFRPAHDWKIKKEDMTAQKSNRPTDFSSTN